MIEALEFISAFTIFIGVMIFALIVPLILLSCMSFGM